MRTLADWLALQERAHPHSIDLTLERVRRVALALDVCVPAERSIIVGGTNGKGSTVAHLDALARAAGLQVGVFTSPHLRLYNERIVISGVPVTDAALIEAFQRIEAARGSTSLTFFEYNALAALWLFRRANLDLAILEVGLGGRLDAANIVDADVAVICSIGLDHCEWLGNTLQEIAIEKAGIARRNRCVIVANADMPASLGATLEKIGALPRIAGRDFHMTRTAPRAWRFSGTRWNLSALPPSALHGEVQYANAAAALAALEALQPPLALDAAMAARALRSVQLAGRFQVIDRAPQWILDVAHNPPAASVLAASLRETPCAGRTIAVCGVLRDKDAHGIAQALSEQIDAWVLCGLQAGVRSMSAAELRQRLPGDCAVVATAESVGEACEAACAVAQCEDRIVVFGSFLTVGPALDWLKL